MLFDIAFIMLLRATRDADGFLVTPHTAAAAPGFAASDATLAGH